MFPFPFLLTLLITEDVNEDIQATKEDGGSGDNNGSEGFDGSCHAVRLVKKGASCFHIVFFLFLGPSSTALAASLELALAALPFCNSYLGS